MSLTYADLDTFRDLYDDMPFPKFRGWCQRIAETWPEQSYWNAAAVREFLTHFKPADVVEIGGWDGGLAAQIGRDAPWLGVPWLNLEVTEVPQVCDEAWYQRRVLEDWPWTWEEWADVVILSHVIEHMSEEHLRKLVAALDGPVAAVYVDAPLHPTLGTRWRYSTTSHVLPLSMREVDAIFAEHGFDVVYKGVSSANEFPSLIRWYA